MKKADKKTPWQGITRAIAFAIFRPNVSIATGKVKPAFR
jgi:hypothetical protein